MQTSKDNWIAERDRFLTIIASAYVIAGHHDAPDHILDVLADPEVATEAQIEAMLPYISTAANSEKAGCLLGDDKEACASCGLTIGQSRLLAGVNLNGAGGRNG